MEAWMLEDSETVVFDCPRIEYRAKEWTPLVPHQSQLGVERRLRAKTVTMILVMIACATTGDLILKQAMTHMGPVEFSMAGLAHAFWLTLLNPMIWMGILFMIGFMLSYMTVLSWADYSFVMPGGALGLVLLTFMAAIFLRETVTPRRWIGVILICAGVMLVGQTKPRTTGVPS
jgi:uncharacterized membrane protein